MAAIDEAPNFAILCQTVFNHFFMNCQGEILQCALKLKISLNCDLVETISLSHSHCASHIFTIGLHMDSIAVKGNKYMVTKYLLENRKIYKPI